MQLLLIRHAIAEDSDTFAGDDTARPLTAAGRKKMIKAAARLPVQIKSIDKIVTSPLHRARATADIIADSYGLTDVIERDDLAPYSPMESLLTWLGQQPSNLRVALVGHNPHLSFLLGTLLTGAPRRLADLKKGSVTSIRFTAGVEAGAGSLHWMMTCKQLATLKKKSGN